MINVVIVRASLLLLSLMDHDKSFKLKLVLNVIKNKAQDRDKSALSKQKLFRHFIGMFQSLSIPLVPSYFSKRSLILGTLPEVFL
jgi:hypothetical protein